MLTAEQITYPIDGTFTISRGAKTHAEVIVCTINTDNVIGRGECVPYARYNETVDSVLKQIDDLSRATSLNELETILNDVAPGAARNAVDCALWDWRAKNSGKSVAEKIGVNPLKSLVTAYTLSLGPPEEMADAARAASARPLIKIKLGGNDDIACMRAVAANAPESRIIVDANEGWHSDNFADLMREAANLNIALIEQPLPVGKDAILANVPHPVPICADESCHTTSDLEKLVGRYDMVNIKLDKTGGLTEALKLKEEARSLGFGIMVGCMVGSSLSMAPAVLLAQNADFVDLDGPLLLAQDCEHPLRYEGSLVSPPTAELWG